MSAATLLLLVSLVLSASPASGQDLKAFPISPVSNTSRDARVTPAEREDSAVFARAQRGQTTRPCVQGSVSVIASQVLLHAGRTQLAVLEHPLLAPAAAIREALLNLPPPVGVLA